MTNELFATAMPDGQVRYGLHGNGQVAAQATIDGKGASELAAQLLVSASEAHNQSKRPWTNKPTSPSFRWVGVRPSATFVAPDPAQGQQQGKILFLSFGEAALGILLGPNEARGLGEDLLGPPSKR